MGRTEHAAGRGTSLIFLVAILVAGVVLSRNVLGQLTSPLAAPPQSPPTRLQALRLLRLEDPGADLLAYRTYGSMGYALYSHGRTWGYWSVAHGGQPRLGTINLYPTGPHQPPLSVSEIWSKPNLLVAIFDEAQAARETQTARIRWTDGHITTVPLAGSRGWIVPSPASAKAAIVRWAAIVLYSPQHLPLFTVTPQGVRWYFPDRATRLGPIPQVGRPQPLAVP